jgi:ribosomal protein L31
MYCGIHRDKIELINQIVERTGCKIVISSAWRYIILGGDMTMLGFEYMLMTHGFAHRFTIIDRTECDELIETRGMQIRHWLLNNRAEKYVVVDDVDLDITSRSHPFVQTDGQVGLVQADVDKIVAILNAD